MQDKGRCHKGEPEGFSRQLWDSSLVESDKVSTRAKPNELKSHSAIHRRCSSREDSTSRYLNVLKQFAPVSLSLDGPLHFDPARVRNRVHATVLGGAD
jgi:hypothetical protein